MNHKIDLKEMGSRIETLRQAAEKLKGAADGFPAVRQNTNRVLASVKMLEMNVNDLKGIGVPM